MKINTDKKLIDEFLTRGVENVYPTREALKKVLLAGKKLRIYQGFDPTGPYLHVGHAIGIRALRILQKLGHEVIFLVGDYTAKIGDPDKDATRKILSDDNIEKNMAGWKKQAGQLIEFAGNNPVQFKRNYQWLSKLRLNEISDLMSRTTVQRMLKRDLFKRRMQDKDNPLHLHELLYPILQGYDGVAMKVDMEIGGADQIFNMLVGRDLSKAYLNKEKFVRANKMMDAPDKHTMSKTQGNGINLSDTPENMYGKAMSYSDNAIISGLELLTEVPIEDIEQIKAEIKNNANPMQFKKLMAYEIVKIVKGEKDAIKAQQHFEQTVQKKELSNKVKSQKLKVKSQNIIDLLTQIKLASSKNEARRLIQQNGIKIDGKVVSDINYQVNVTKQGVLVQRGKRQFVKVNNF